MNDRKKLAVNKSIMMLHDDLLLNCLARVSRSYYPTLSLVCKTFRSLVASTELYQTRTLLGRRTETCLYLRFLFRTEPRCRWFILSRKGLVPILSPNSPSVPGSVVVVGHNIYSIGGGGSEYNASYSSRVAVMDTRSHTWLEAPSMRVARLSPPACTIDGKIYVVGGCLNVDSTNWIEVFDTKTQTWEFLQTPSYEIFGEFTDQILGYEGTIFVRSHSRDTTYKLHRGKWRAADMAVNWRFRSPSPHCVIENVFYCVNKMGFGWYQYSWYEPKEKVWKSLKGLDELVPRIPKFNCRVQLADHGGDMAILWKEPVNKKTTIWCAVIALQKCQDGEIWGTLKWPKNLLVDNVSSHQVDLKDEHVLAATVC